MNKLADFNPVRAL